MKFAVRAFLGEIPRLEPFRLPNNNATGAFNVKNFRGNCEPFKTMQFVSTLAKVGEKKALYRFGQDLDSESQYWFHWLNDTDVARGPTTGNDTEERTYYTEATQPPMMTDATMATAGAAMPFASYLLGLPAPGVTPTLALADPFKTFHTTNNVDGTADTVTATAHGFTSGTPVTYSKQSGSAAIGLTDAYVYYVRAVSADALSFHPTATDAIENTNKIDLTAAGAETHKLTRGAPYGAVAVNLLVGYTYVNSWLHEGPMSVVSTSTSYYDGQTLTVSTLEAGPIGNYNVTKKRLYVAQTDATGRTVLRFWKEINANVSSTSGEVDFTTLGSANQSPEPIAPPTTLMGLAAHPNGFMVGFDPVTKRFCRSEVFKPYAWPAEYADPLDDVPVANCVIGQAVVIGTRGPTYLASGNDPLRMLPVRLEGKQPCVAKRTMLLTNAGVIYASPDGLVAVTPDGRMELATRALFTRDQWQAFRPDSMWAVVHDERYFLYWKVASDNKGLMIFDFTGDGLGIITSNEWASAGYADPKRDALFLVLSDGNAHKWDAGIGYLPMQWISKELVLDKPANFGCAQLIGDFRGPATLSVYGDAVLRDTITVTSSDPFQLDRSYMARAYRFVINGPAVIREMLVADTMAALARE